ncbi:universal stress protein [Noviherbaspirillum denitrificans]|uniref:Universal stress protein n=1 Tax=Noviherbaspirillum denitrificans TaxID=1968433 RepID=A0A254TGX8_9BURK|nr:universal stress protein [Noviherbaspirillum denitrificans]OWW19793.1 universal stress protein [Noviherbaspirillum denitrificans]
MLKILLAVDGSDSALHAAAYVAKRASAAKGEYEVHLVNVQYPLHGSVASFVDSSQIKQYHHEEGMKILNAARAQLDAAGTSSEAHLFVGEPAEVITRFAKEQGCDEIVIGTRGLSGISSLLVGSVATKIIHLSEVPVLLVK